VAGFEMHGDTIGCFVGFFLVSYFFGWPDLPKFKKATNAKAVPKLADLSGAEFFSVVNRLDELSPQERPKYEPALAEFTELLIKGILNTSKADWAKLANQTQITYWSILETGLEGIGYTKEDASGFSLFVGPFMDSAPPQATVQDAVMVYKSQLNDRRIQQGLVAIEKVLDFAITATQIGQALQHEP
jgi:hypothetical protein